MISNSKHLSTIDFCRENGIATAIHVLVTGLLVSISDKNIGTWKIYR